VVLGGLFVSVGAIDNGKGLTPPMGWRSWNLFGADVNQELIQSQMDGMVSRKRTVNGVPTSILDLGYSDVGLDDAWQLCGDYGSEHFTYHDESGKPVVDTLLFPDFNAMTSYAHSYGLTAGWYANNCICEDHCNSDACYQQDVEALISYGFDSVKLDACGKELDLQKWSDLIAATGKSILIENCHWGFSRPNETWCPFNYYRTSMDVRASYQSVLKNLMSTIPFAKKNLSTPGCWGYPDMLEVGCQNGPGGEHDPGLSFVEARTHFGAWCIVSSPLILSHDTMNDTVTDEIWPIISNTEAISINQAYAGDSGSLFMTSRDTVELRSRDEEDSERTIVASWQQWSKKLSDSKAAVLIMNNADSVQEVTLVFKTIPTFEGKGMTEFSIRDIWEHTDLGTFDGSYSVSLESHDSAFLVLSAV